MTIFRSNWPDILICGLVVAGAGWWFLQEPSLQDQATIVQHVQDQRKATSSFEDWLKKEGTPEDRHMFVLGANWDFTDIKLFEWIASQPDCDKATALVLFWKGQADYYATFDNEADVPSVNIEGFKLFKLIRERWLAGKYTRSAIAFEMERDVWKQDFEKIDESLGAKAQEKLPVSMRSDISGKRLAEDCCTEGIPNRFWPNGGGRI